MRHLSTAILFVSLILLQGCGDSALLMLDKDPNFKKSLDLTQKKQFKIEGKTLAIVRATYLNPIYPEHYRDYQYFFVGIHIQDDMKNDFAGINNPHYNLTMNDHNMTGYDMIDESEPLYRHMPLVERWTHYYVVAFDDNSSAKLDLVYKKDTNESLKFSFRRYVIPE